MIDLLPSNNLVQLAGWLIAFVLGTGATAVIKILLFPAQRKRATAEAESLTHNAQAGAFQTAEAMTDTLTKMKQAIAQLHNENLEAAKENARLLTQVTELKIENESLVNRIAELEIGAQKAQEIIEGQAEKIERLTELVGEYEGESE